VKLTFPLPVNLANSRLHHFVKHSKRKAYWRLLDGLLTLGRLPEPPHRPWVRVEATVTYYVWNRMDQGNAMNRLKWIEDWLTSRGYLVDDREENLAYTGLPRQLINRKKGQQRVELELRPT